MLRLARSYSRRLFSGYSSSSDIEDPVEYTFNKEECGIIVRHLPKEQNLYALKNMLITHFEPYSVSLYPNIKGEASYAYLKFNDSLQLEQALSLNKKHLSGRKLYLQVKFI